MVNQPTRPAVQMRRNFLPACPADTHNRIRTETCHHPVEPHPGHRRHGNQQGGKYQSQAQLLGNRIHNCRLTAAADDFRHEVSRGRAAEKVADQIHADFRHHAEHHAGKYGCQPVV